MNRFNLLLILLLISTAFSVTDLYLNDIHLTSADKKPKIPVAAESNLKPASKEDPFSDSLLNQDLLFDRFKVSDLSETHFLFDQINLKGLKGIQMNKALLTLPESIESPILIYELINSEGKGDLMYLSVKLETLSQINEKTETLNETNDFGKSSFFYNTESFKKTGFLLARIHNRLYAFQYSKRDPSVYEEVKNLIKQIESSDKSI